jgi:hypothetical protein
MEGQRERRVVQTRRSKLQVLRFQEDSLFQEVNLAQTKEAQ